MNYNEMQTGSTSAWGAFPSLPKEMVCMTVCHLKTPTPPIGTMEYFKTFAVPVKLGYRPCGVVKSGIVAGQQLLLGFPL